MKLIGLDVGTKRIGVAKADSTTKIAVPDGFVNVNGQEFAEIARLARLYSTTTFIVVCRAIILVKRRSSRSMSAISRDGLL